MIVEFAYFDEQTPNLPVFHPVTEQKLYLVETPDFVKECYAPIEYYEKPLELNILEKYLN